MCLCSRKKSEVRLETQPPVSILQRSPALGVEPNSALIDRIHSFKEPAKDLSIKKGDLIFSLKELKKVPKASGNNKYDSKQNVRVQKCELDADDDTLYPKPISMSKNEADQDEVDDEVSTETPECDPYAPLEELEKREGFNCQTLRKNTFLANALSMPNEKERKKRNKPKSSHVSFFPPKATFSRILILLSKNI
uniref:Bm10565, isoform a n=1 Tax=Brugia malayi TaxID=6279 RepID=A0A1I9GDG6_BRUMA|nr:Bm10565, isoform a [Brugia malayi]